MKIERNQVIEIPGALFKKIIKGKGWMLSEVALRWGCTPDWIGRLCRVDERPAHYNDAVLALPNKRYLSQEVSRRRSQLERLGRTGSDGSSLVELSFSVSVGEILTAMEDVGTLAYEGDRVLVVATKLQSGMRQYGILFSSGVFDWFWQPDVDHFFAQTGLESEPAKHYLFSDSSKLRDDYLNGLLTF